MTKITAVGEMLGIPLIMMGLGSLFLGMWGTGFVLLGIGGVYLGFGVKFIQNDPPHNGIITVLGKRINRVKKEGWRLFIPFVENAILINVQKRQLDIIPEDIRSEENVELKVDIALSWKPDPDRLIDFLNVGEDTAKSLMSFKAQEIVRREMRELTWKNCLGFQEEGTQKLIREMTQGDTETREQLREKNGVADNEGWGILILEIYVKTIKVLGRMAEEIDRPAREERQRKAETYEVRTIEKQKNIIKKMAPELTDKEALETAMIARNLIQKRIYGLSSGLEKVADSAVKEIVRGILSKRGGKS